MSGNHTYTAVGTDIVTVTLSDDAPATATATATSTANVSGQLAGQVTLSTATEGTALPATTTVATFTDSNTSDTAGNFTASIAWGDGTTTTGTVSGSNGSFAVAGGHTYADEASDMLGVVITPISGSPLTLNGTVAVPESDALTATNGQTFTAEAGQAFSGTVATFTDTNTTNVAGDFTATIDWGDGTPPTTGTITDTGGTITVSGSHTYASAYKRGQ